MSKKIVLTLTFILSQALNMQAAEVSPERASAVAQQLVSARVDGFNTEIASVTTMSYEGQKAYYVVQFKAGGWALISADDNSTPLIGYSDSGIYQTEGQPSNVKGMMEVFGQQVVRNAHLMNVRSHSGWEVQSANRTARASSTNKISPLITVNWNQTGAYQKYCPKDANGQAVVGCVAVGMAQAMSVAKYPSRPVGTYTYNSNTYGSIYIDYDKEPDYNWSAILSGANGKDDVARLLYHCGVSVNMDYGVSGSGTQTAYIVSALKRNFQYPQSVAYYKRDDYTGDWSELILTELREGRAVAYSGSDPKKNYGHCFNLDGYDGSFFHVNWGWGGSNNGYFPLDGLRDNTMDMDYTDGQGVVVGFRAPSIYPSNILLSNNTVQTSQPAGTVVGSVTVESEATNPTYTFTIQGEYSPIFHTYLPAPFQVVDGFLVTSKELKLDDYPQGIGIDITAKNNENGGSVTRHFTIYITNSAGIDNLVTDQDVILEQTYNLLGQHAVSSQKGIQVVRRKMSDGSVRTTKIVHP